MCNQSRPKNLRIIKIPDAKRKNLPSPSTTKAHF
ncbi:hypothetical protein BT93_H2625 [Corymbia citriodora subsp. variegata]|nr:hypothetical protein BT93_H2625 [Corymbia citriodora subsp. variegata]